MVVQESGLAAERNSRGVCNSCYHPFESTRLDGLSGSMTMSQLRRFSRNPRAAEIRAMPGFRRPGGEWFWEQDAEFRFTSFFGNFTEQLRVSQGEFIGKRRWELPMVGVEPGRLAEHVAVHERHEPFRGISCKRNGGAGWVDPSTSW